MSLAGNVGKCVCWLHPSNNDRHFCLSPTCRKCRPDTLATFCYFGQFFGCQCRVGDFHSRHIFLHVRRNQYSTSAWLMYAQKTTNEEQTRNDLILNITVTIKRPTLPWRPSTSTGFVANAPIRMRAVIQGPATFVRHPTQSARGWWFLSPLPCRRQSLCAFSSQQAPPVLPLTCPLQMWCRLWHPHRRQSLCALANQRTTPVLSLICLIQMRRRLWHPPRCWQRL